MSFCLTFGKNLEEDVPHRLGHLRRVAGDLEDVQDHLEARLRVVVYLFGDRIGVFRLDQGELCGFG
jgi:hypothetical protein